MTLTRVTGAVLLAALIGACSGPGPTPVPTQPASASQSPAQSSSARPTNPPTLSGNLTIWHTYGADSPGVARGVPEALGAALNLVRNENPQLNLTVTQVSLGDLFISYQLQAGQGSPDAVFAPNDNLGDLARAGLTTDLSSSFTADELSDFSPLAIDGSSIGGKLVQVPATLRTVGIYYLTDRIPAFPATTDDLLAAVQGGNIKLGLSQAMYPLFGFWGAFGGQLMDANGKCIADTTGVDQAFAYYSALKGAGATWYPAPDGDARMVADFESGAVDAIIDGPWAGDGYRDAHPGTLAVAPLPAGPGGTAQPMIGVDGWVINPRSANGALAVAFAKRMTQPDILAILSGQAIQIPADPGVQPADPLAAQFAAAAQSGAPRPQVPQLGMFWGPFSNALTAVVDNGADPHQSVTDACTAMNSANGL
jgi:arabinogalactan oligomer/maltooligosaccharide transport system substrate-binding protein